MAPSRHASGFTLIELMITVAIIGVLSSVAIPEFERLMVRSKEAERRHVMNTIKTGVEDLFLQNGDLPIDPDAGVPYPVLVGPATPALPAQPVKRMPDWTQDDWNKVLRTRSGAGSGAPDIEGALYYSYSFSVTRAATGALLVVQAEGDLDGDNDPAIRTSTYERDQGGVFRLLSDFPVGWLNGAEDGKL